MIGKKTVALFIGVFVLILVGGAISFAGGPGILRDIIPIFGFGEVEEVEWDQVFHIENPEFVVVAINPTDVNDNDNYYYRYMPIRQVFGARAGEIVSSWEFHLGSWPVPEREWNRLVLSDIFTSYPAPQNALLTNLREMDFETGLQEILRHYVHNRDDFTLDTNFEIYIGGSSVPLSYEEEDSRLRDVDFIIDTINRGTRGYKKENAIDWGLE